jgi:hypothetical protein
MGISMIRIEKELNSVSIIRQRKAEAPCLMTKSVNRNDRF